MAEVWFYHLQNQPLGRALPALLEKALERGWRVAIQGGDAEALKKLDEVLWTYAPDSFLAHGSAGDKDAERQPIVLTGESDNPNDAALRIFVQGAEVAVTSQADYQRIILVFDGRDDDEVAAARGQWSRLKAEGHTLAYWQQDEHGRWEKKM
jgi:DNA polymerase III subunit chi